MDSAFTAAWWRVATATKIGWGNLSARGFGGEPGHAGARSLRPEVAGTASVWYVYPAPDGSETEFRFDEALVLRGDPSRPGDSGGPVLELSAGAVVGLMAAGPGFGERSFVVPLHRAVEGFPDLTAEASAEASVTVKLVFKGRG
jgi:hypothetical protein